MYPPLMHKLVIHTLGKSEIYEISSKDYDQEHIEQKFNQNSFSGAGSS